MSRLVTDESLTDRAIGHLVEHSKGDGHTFAELCRSHRITGRVLAAIESGRSISVENVANRLSVVREDETARIRQVRQTLSGLMDEGVLSDGGVLIKGPAVAAHLGKDYLARVSNDLDIAGGPSTSSRILAAGYTASGLAICHELGWFSAPGRTPVDLHDHIPVWRVDQRVRSTPLRFSDVEEHLVSDETLGVIPSPELAALISCAQLYRDCVEYPLWDVTSVRLAELLELDDLIHAEGFDDVSFQQLIAVYNADEALAFSRGLVDLLRGELEDIVVRHEVARGILGDSVQTVESLLTPSLFFENALARFDTEPVEVSTGSRPLEPWLRSSNRDETVDLWGSVSVESNGSRSELDVVANFRNSVAYKDEVSISGGGFSIRAQRSMHSPKVTIYRYGDCGDVAATGVGRDGRLHLRMAFDSRRHPGPFLLGAHHFVEPLRRDWNHLYERALDSYAVLIDW